MTLPLRLPVELWRVDIWQHGLANHAPIIMRWSMMCRESRRVYMDHCGGLRVWGGVRWGYPFGNAHIAALPPRLVHLNVEYHQWGVTAECIKALPRTLKTLAMRIHYLEDVHVADLPRELVRLKLPWSYCLTDACAARLPHGLQYLDLRATKLLTDAFIRQLPRGLIHLDLGGSCELTDACVKDLPRTLEHLDVEHSTKLTDACIKHLPRGLRYVNVTHNMALSNACIADMPPGLETLKAQQSLVSQWTLFRIVVLAREAVATKQACNIS